MKLTIKIGRRTSTCPVADLFDASWIYQNIRDAERVGCSKMREGRVTEGETLVGIISYNGRVWAPDGETLISEAAGAKAVKP